MEDTNGNKPIVVTSSLSFQVTTPSFYNQPKRFASVAPPRPKGQSNQVQPLSFSSPIASAATVGRVGEIPPPPSSISDGKTAVLNALISLLIWGLITLGEHSIWQILWGDWTGVECSELAANSIFKSHIQSVSWMNINS